MMLPSAHAVTSRGTPRRCRLSMFAAGLSDEAIDQERNIVFAVTQRRQVQRQNSQAVVEVLPNCLALTNSVKSLFEAEMTRASILID